MGKQIFSNFWPNFGPYLVHIMYRISSIRTREQNQILVNFWSTFSPIQSNSWVSKTYFFQLIDFSDIDRNAEITWEEFLAFQAKAKASLKASWPFDVTQIRREFTDIDSDGSGTISKPEFINIFSNTYTIRLVFDPKKKQLFYLKQILPLQKYIVLSPFLYKLVHLGPLCVGCKKNRIEISSFFRKSIQ